MNGRLVASPSTRAASGISRSQPQVDGGFDPLPEDEAGLMSTIGSTAASGLSGAANFLDLITGASSIRDVIGLAGTGNWEKYNPFDQFLSPFTSEDRTYAREDLLPDLGLMRPNQETGITGWWDDPGEGIRDIGGFLTDVALDPIGLSLGGLGTFKTLGKGGSVLSKASAKNIPKSRLDRIRTTVREAAPPVGPLDDIMGPSQVPRPVTAAQFEELGNLEHAARKSGYESAADFLAQHGDEPVGGLLSLHKGPFAGPSKAIGTGPTAEKIAGGLDVLGSVIAEGKIPGTDYSPGRHATALFDKAVRGARKSAAGVKIGRGVTDVADEAELESLNAYIPYHQKFGEYLDKLTGHEQIESYGQLRSAMEGVEELPDKLKFMQPAVDAQAKIRDSMVTLDRQEGLISNVLDDVFVEYVRRQKHMFPGDKSKNADWGSRLLSGKHTSQIGRKGFLRDWRGGTDLINKLSLDENLSGVIDRLGLDVDNLPEGFRVNQRKKLQEALVSMEPKRQNWLNVDEHDDMAGWLAGLDGRHYTGQIPVFPGDPLVDSQRRLEFSLRGRGGSKVIREVVLEKGNLRVGMKSDPSDVRLVDVIDKAGGYDKDVWMQRLLEEMEGRPPGTLPARPAGGASAGPSAPLAGPAVPGAVPGAPTAGPAAPGAAVPSDGPVKLGAIDPWDMSKRELDESVGPVPSGHTRLYRVDATQKGELSEWVRESAEYKGAEGNFGRFYTDKPSTLKFYAEDAGGKGKFKVSYVDVSDADISKYHVKNIPLKPGGKDVPGNPMAFSKDPETEYFLPPRDAPTGAQVPTPPPAPAAQAAPAPAPAAKQPQMSLEEFRASEQGRSAAEYLKNQRVDVDKEVESLWELLDKEGKLPPRAVVPAAEEIAEEAAEEVAEEIAEEVAGEAVEEIAEEAPKIPQKYLDRARARLVTAGVSERDIQKLSPDELLSLVGGEQGVSKDLSKMYISRELADDILRVTKSFQSPEEIHPLLNFLDRYTRLWKAGVTSFPGFHSRNMTSGQIANSIAGAWSRKSFANIDALVRGRRTMTGLQELGGKYAKLSDLEASKMFGQEMYAHKVARPGMGAGAEDLSALGIQKGIYESIPGARPESFWNITKSLNPFKWSKDEWKPWKVAGVSGETDVNAVVAASRRIGSYTEAMNRGVPYLELRLKGFSPAEAAKRVAAIQVDYDSLSQFERNVMRRVFPFYTFGAGQAKFLAKELADRPGGAFGQVIRAQGYAHERDEPVPEYVAQTMALPLGELDDGTKRYLTGLGLMHEDPLSFGGGGFSGAVTEAVSRMVEPAKYLAEVASGETFFQRGPLGGRELTDLDPTFGRIATSLGLQDEMASGRAKPIVSRGFEHALNLVPFVPKALGTIPRTLLDERKGIAAKLLNVMTGARVSDISPASRAALIREMAFAMGREQGARSFTTTYFSKEEIEETQKTDPEKARRMAALNALRNMLAQASRERRREAEEAEEVEQVE